MSPVASVPLSRVREHTDPPAKNFLKSGPVSAIGIGPEALVLVVQKSLDRASIRRNRRPRGHTRTFRTRCVCFAIRVCTYIRCQTYVRIYTHTYMYIFIYRYIFGYFFWSWCKGNVNHFLFCFNRKNRVFRNIERTCLFSFSFCGNFETFQKIHDLET